MKQEARREGILVAVAHESEAEAVMKAMASVRPDIELLLTGVGGAAMSWALQKRFCQGSLPALAVNAGIAGSYTERFTTGDVVIVRSDCFADMGIDDNGSFRSLFSASLADPDRPPFSGGRIICRGEAYDKAAAFIPAADGATVNMASGSMPVIERIRRAWNPEIETMEGAWFSYACSVRDVEWIDVRAVSNMVEPRDTARWNIRLALDNLTSVMSELLMKLSVR